MVRSRCSSKTAARARTRRTSRTRRRASGKPVIEGGSGWVQALERSDHAEIVAGWNAKTLEEGATIYKTLCVVCHGTKEQPGSLPTALRFAEGQFKNGSDPFSMYLTLTKGFGQMVPQPQYTTAQKYAVIHYIRETFLRPHNPSQLKDIDLASLPRGLARAEAEKIDTTLPPYQRMELGNALVLDAMRSLRTTSRKKASPSGSMTAPAV
jgi:cytochrome c5